MLPRLPRLSSILARGAKRGLRTAFRHEGVATGVGALFGVLFLAQALLLLIVGMHAQLSLLRQQTDVRLVVRDGVTAQQISSFVVSLGQQPYVEDIVYITPEQAYERVKARDPELISFLTQYDFDNPFPSTIGVRLKTLDDFRTLVTYLNTPETLRIVDPNFLEASEQDSQIAIVERASRAAQSFIAAILFLLLVVLLSVLIELVRRRVVLRREEILVQQLVGATPLAILIPFGVEILTLLMLGLTLAFGSMTVVLFLLPRFVPSLAEGGIFAPWAFELAQLLRTFAPWVIIGEFLLLPILAFFGSLFGLLPRLRRPTLSMS